MVAKRPKLDHKKNSTWLPPTLSAKNFYTATLQTQRENKTYHIQFFDFFLKFFNIPVDNSEQLNAILHISFENFIKVVKNLSKPPPNYKSDFAAFEFVDDNLPGGLVALPFVRLDNIGAGQLANTISDILQ